MLRQLEKLDLDKKFLVAQAYDGASAMSGVCKGTQARILAECPSAVYIHCVSHCLNLVLGKSIDIPKIRAAVTGDQNACLYFKHSAKRVDQLQQAVARLCPESRHTRLKQYCATRWVERLDVIVVFLKQYDPLIEVLHNNVELALVVQLTEPRFMISLLMLNKVLGLTKGISESL